MKWAVLGLENMFNGGAAVFAAATHPDADALELRVRGEGSLLMYLSERPQNVFCGNVEGVPLEFSYADGEGLLRVVLPPRFQVFWRLPTSAVLYYCCSLLLRLTAADCFFHPACSARHAKAKQTWAHCSQFLCEVARFLHLST